VSSGTACAGQARAPEPHIDPSRLKLEGPALATFSITPIPLPCIARSICAMLLANGAADKPKQLLFLPFSRRPRRRSGAWHKPLGDGRLFRTHCPTSTLRPPSVCSFRHGPGKAANGPGKRAALRCSPS